MRILLVSEGPHELSGALENLVRRLMNPAVGDLQFETEKMANAAIVSSHGKGPRLLKRILRWMEEARRRGCEALVLVIDEDGDRERRGHIDSAQNSTMFDIQRAVGIAIRTFDAWMICDESAMSKVCTAAIPCQPSPEEMANPKEVFYELLRGSGAKLRMGEAYAQVGQQARLDVLAQRCVHGFAPFAARVKQIHN